MRRIRHVYRGYFQKLKPFGAPDGFANDARALEHKLKSILAQGRNVQKDVGAALIGGYESVTFSGVEPFDEARDLNEGQTIRLS
jgi:hypothetical protein